MLLTHYREDFDSVHRLKLLDEEEGFGVPRKLHKISTLNIDDWCQESRIFKISSGVTEGDALLALLFDLALHKVTQDTDTDR